MGNYTLALLTPSRKEIETLPTPLTDEERLFLGALVEALDDQWNIYVTPHLNGLRPSFVIFSRRSGIGIIDVKECSLNRTSVTIRDDNSICWKEAWSDGARYDFPESPLDHVRTCSRTLLEHELTELFVKSLTDRRYCNIIRPFVFFSSHEIQWLNEAIPSIARRRVSLLGYDQLDPSMLRLALINGGLPTDTGIPELTTDALLHHLENVLGYPQRSTVDQRLASFSVAKLSPQQRDLLPNDSSSRRVIGSAGSGKSHVAILKAVQAAVDGKRVLLTCFNITMATYLRRFVTDLASQHGPHVICKIEVKHFHAPRNMQTLIDVLLVDEGQDFEPKWLEHLESLRAPGSHRMVFVDQRQNIYERDRNVGLPGAVRAYPDILKSSYRVPRSIANLANAIASLTKLEDDINLEPVDNNVELPFQRPDTNALATWYNCNSISGAVDSLVAAVQAQLGRTERPRPSDMVASVLVCRSAELSGVI
jgi:hypothetical protein